MATDGRSLAAVVVHPIEWGGKTRDQTILL
jgi:hypothetical protein